MCIDGLKSTVQLQIILSAYTRCFMALPLKQINSMQLFAFRPRLLQSIVKGLICQSGKVMMGLTLTMTWTVLIKTHE